MNIIVYFIIPSKNSNKYNGHSLWSAISWHFKMKCLNNQGHVLAFLFYFFVNILKHKLEVNTKKKMLHIT